MGYRDDINYFRRLLEEDPSFANVMGGSSVAPGAMPYEEQGNFGATPDFSNVRGGSSVANVLAQLQQQQRVPDVMPPATPIEQPAQRWQSTAAQREAPPPMNSMRIESGPRAGEVISLNFNNGPSEPQGPMPDYSQPIEIAGVGKGYWEKGGTGNAIVNGRRVALGVDRDATNKRRMQEIALAASRQKLEKGRVGIAKDLEELFAMGQPKRREAPAGYRYGPDGQTLQFIPGGPADPANSKKDQPSEDERRSAGLAVRMEGALKLMNQHPDAAKPELVAETARKVNEPLANWLTSGNRQQVEGAQLDALDAALTLATGAAYTKDQLKNLSKSYFPQIGDDEDTVKGKKERLAKVIETARIRAGRAKGDIDRVTGGGAAGGAPRRIQNDAEYAALPSGSEYIDPTGKRRRKA